MPRYEYRNIQPLPAAEKSVSDWIQKLDEQFANRNVEHRCLVVRNTLHELYLGPALCRSGGQRFAGGAGDGPQL